MLNHQVKQQDSMREINLVLDSATLLETVDSLNKVRLQLDSIAKKSQN